MKLFFIVFTILSIAAFGWSTRVSIPVGVTTNPALEALATFFPRLHPTPVPVHNVPSLREVRKKRLEEVAAERASDEWAVEFEGI